MAEYHSQIPYEQVNPDTGEVKYSCFGDCESGRNAQGQMVCKKKRMASHNSKLNSTTAYVILAVFVVVVIALLLAYSRYGRGGWHRGAGWGRPRVTFAV